MRRDTYALFLAARHPRTPWYAKALAASVAAYALSPIDLIPDFIPILGYLDDLILIPVGVVLAIRLVPPPVMSECRDRASATLERPQSRSGLWVVLGIWALFLIIGLWATSRVLHLF